MEITDTNLVKLAEYLQQTLSPDVSQRKPGKFGNSQITKDPGLEGHH